MLEWMKELKLLCEVEYPARRPVVTLATVGLDGCPRARSVIVRELDVKTGALCITTDERSEKIPELKQNPAAEIVFWASHERVQFRLRGPIEIVRDGPARDEQWQNLTDASRATFFWPTPGSVRQPTDLFQKVATADLPIPEVFLLLVMHSTEVEALELNDFPHRRRRWTAANQWEMQLLNP